MGLLKRWFCMGQKADGGTLRLGEKRFVPSFAAVLRHFIAAQASSENRLRPAGLESRRMGSKKPATGRVTGFSSSMVPPTGYPRAAAPPAPAAALRALRAVLENAARFLSSAPCRVRIPAFGQQKARYREGNGLLKFDGAPNGIRTRDIHLERVASLAARRWGQRS